MPGVEYNQRELAQILGYTPKQVSEFMRTGMPCVKKGRPGRGHGSVLNSAEVHHWLVRRAAGDAKGSGNDPRHTLATINAETAAIALRERKGEVIRPERLIQAIDERLIGVRSGTLGIPARLKSRIPGLDAKIITALDDLIREALDGIAEEGLPEELRKVG